MEVYCSNSSNRCCCCRRKWPLEVAFSGCSGVASCRCCFCTSFEHLRTHGQHDTGDDRDTMSMLGSHSLTDSGCLTVSGLFLIFSFRRKKGANFARSIQLWQRRLRDMVCCWLFRTCTVGSSAFLPLISLGVRL